MKNSGERHCVRDIKQTLCYVAEDHDEECKMVKNVSKYTFQMEKIIIVIDLESCRGPGMLFALVRWVKNLMVLMNYSSE